MSNPDDIIHPADESSSKGELPAKQVSSSNNSDSKEQGDGGRIIPAAEPVVPITTINSDKAVLSVLVNPSVMEALVQDAPQDVLKFAEASDERQFKYYMQQEQNRHQERMAREATTRIAIGSVGGAVLAAFVYSAYTGDTNLSSTIVTAIIGGFGGLGISKFFQPKEEE